MASQPNVVLVVTDTTRADDAFDPRVGPTLADLGRTGTRATQAFSTAPWTLPSHGSLFTGTYPSKHGAHAEHERLDEDPPVLPELFADAGYETVGLSNNTWVSTEGGFARGFEQFQQMWQLVQSSAAIGEVDDVLEESRPRALLRAIFDGTGNPLVNAANVLYHFLARGRAEGGGERTTRWIDDWLTGRDEDRPFFLFANYLEPHLEYRPPERLADRHLPDDVSYEEAMEIPQEPWRYLAGEVELSDHELQILRELYRAEISLFDEHLADLKESLQAAGEWEDTLLVVVADHGENVGHHGMMDHQYCLYDSLLHVPLVLHGDAFTDGEELTDLVSVADIAPTLLDAANIDAPEARAEFQGQSFHPGAEPDPREFLVAEYMGPQPTMEALEQHVEELPEHVFELDRSLRAIRTEDWKFIRGSDGSTELYDLDADPTEGRNLAADRPEQVEALSERLDDWLDSFEAADSEEDVSLDPERKAQLEELGYLR